MSRILGIGILILAIAAGFASAQSGDANSPKSEDKQEVSISASEHAERCSKNMKVNSRGATKYHPMQKGKTAEEK